MTYDAQLDLSEPELVTRAQHSCPLAIVHETSNVAELSLAESIAVADNQIRPGKLHLKGLQRPKIC